MGNEIFKNGVSVLKENYSYIPQEVKEAMSSNNRTANPYVPGTTAHFRTTEQEQLKNSNNSSDKKTTNRTVVERAVQLVKASQKKQYDQTIQTLQNVDQQLVDRGFSKLTSKEYSFCLSKLPQVLEKNNLVATPQQQADIMKKLYVSGEISAIDLERFGIITSSKDREKQAIEITEAYSPGYKKRLDNEQYEKQRTDNILRAMTPFIAVNETVQETVKGTYGIVVEPNLKLGELGVNYVGNKLGVVSDESYNKKQDAYINYANSLTSGLGSVAKSIVSTDASENLLTASLYRSINNAGAFFIGQMSVC